MDEITQALHYSRSDSVSCTGIALLINNWGEAEMELAFVVGLRLRACRVSYLPVLHSISRHTRFSLGEFSAVCDRRDISDRWIEAGVSLTRNLPWQDFRFDLRGGQRFGVRIFFLHHFLHAETVAGVAGSAAGWPEGT